MYQFLKFNFKNQIIGLDSFRSKKDDAFKVYFRSKHRYLLGKEIIVESILLSFCNQFMFVQTNVSNFVRFINPEIKIEIIDNGMNSKNEYIAKYLWTVKNNLPSFLGGFKNNL